MTAGTFPDAGLAPLGRRVGQAVARLRVSRDGLRRALFLLIIVTISRVHQHYGFLAVLRPALLLTAAVGGYAYLNPHLLAPGSITRTVPGKVMIGLLIMACLSTPFGISMGNSGKFILDVYVRTIIFGVIVFAAIRGARDLYLVLWGLVVSCGILAFMALFVFQLTTYNGYARLNDLYTYDANDVGCVLVTGLALVILAMNFSRGFQRLACLLIAVGMMAAIARTGSRGAMVGLVMVGVALLLSPTGVSIIKRILFIAVLTGGMIAYAPPGYWKQMSTILKPEDDYNFTAPDGRKQVAQRGIKYMLSYPAFGVGINNFSKAECTISELARNHVVGTGLRCTPPHNSYIQAGAELGVPGLLLWLAFVTYSTVGVWRIHRRLPAAWRRGTPERRFLYQATVYVPIAMTGFAVTAFFLSFAWMDITYLLLAFIAALVVCVERELAGDGAGETPLAAAPLPAPARRRRR